MFFFQPSFQLIAFLTLLFVVPPAGRAAVVINEIAYHPISDASSEEFIELYNTGPGAIDLSGWTIDGAGYTFPAATSLASGEFRVIAKDPAAFAAIYPAAPSVLGPYSGQMQNSGERIRLLDAAEVVVDSVEYADALPWPTAPDGDGPTLELRHPSLDNSRPESWAASEITYDASASWETIDVVLSPVAGTFFFYLSDLDGTGWIGDADSIHVLFDDFSLTSSTLPGINLFADGGFESGSGSSWVANGSHHTGFVSPEEACSGKYCYHYWSLESGNAASRSMRYEPTVPVNLSAASSYRFKARYKVLDGRANLLVGAGAAVGAGPILIEKRKAWGTPGAPNTVLRAQQTPLLSDLTEVDSPMTAGVGVETAATFSDVSLIASAELWYSVQSIAFNGLVPTPDEAVWQSIPLVPDAAPNQATFRATVPGQPANTILRYHLRWTDANGEGHRYPQVGSYPRNLIAYVPGPAPDYGVPNYFLHLVPEYHAYYLSMMFAGDVVPGMMGIFRFNRPTFPATFIDLEDQKIYEDVAWKPRGWDNLFNALAQGFRVGVSLEFRPGFLYKGEKRELDLNNNLSRVGEAGMRTRMAHEVYRRAGVPAPRTRYVWMNQNGVEIGLMLDIESPDDVWLARWGRDGEGSLYKARWSFQGPVFIQNNLLRGNESVYAAPDHYERCYLKKNRRNSNHSDLVGLIANLNAPALACRVFEMAGNGSDIAGQKAFFETQIDLPNLLKKYGVDSVLANHDRGQQNHYLYQDVSGDGRWETYPWDLDLTWEIGTRDLWNTLGQFPGGGGLTEDPAFTPDWWFYQAEPTFTRMMAVPEYRAAYVLGVRDQLRTTFSERQLFEVADAYGQEGFGGFERDKVVWPAITAPTLDIVANVFKDRLKRARQAAFWRARNEDLDGTAIPPVLSDGRTSPGIPRPTDSIQFRVNAISSGLSNLAEGIATVTAAYRLNSGATQTIAMARTSPTTYDGDYMAALSAQPEGTQIEFWFETVDDLGLTDRLPQSGSFFTEIVGAPGAAESQVTISEIMYHSDRLGNEWIEIENASSRYVDLSRWQLGDDDPTHRFRFPVDLILAPGERLVVASNEFVVRELYGIENVVGDVVFNFSNGGDTVSVYDANGIQIDTVTYSDDSPWSMPADGGGPSLELKPGASENSAATSWQASVALRGTPGLPNGNPGIGVAVVINELSYDPSDGGVARDFNADGVGNEEQDEFVEIYNTTNQAIDISGWTLDDDNPGNGNTFVFQPATILSPNGFVVVFGGGIPTGFNVPTFVGLPRLGNSGDQIRLHDGNEEVDSVGFESGAAGTLNNLVFESDGGVAARVTDGSLAFEPRDPDEATPGATNNLDGPPLDVSGWQFY